MSALEIVTMILVWAFVVCGILKFVGINAPQTPEEEEAELEQDMKDFAADMAERKARKEQGK